MSIALSTPLIAPHCPRLRERIKGCLLWVGSAFSRAFLLPRAVRMRKPAFDALCEHRWDVASPDRNDHAHASVFTEGTAHF